MPRYERHPGACNKLVVERVFFGPFYGKQERFFRSSSVYEDVDDEEKDSRNPIKCLLETEMKKFMEMMREERREICLFGVRGKIILR